MRTTCCSLAQTLDWSFPCDQNVIRSVEILASGNEVSSRLFTRISGSRFNAHEVLSRQLRTSHFDQEWAIASDLLTRLCGLAHAWPLLTSPHVVRSMLRPSQPLAARKLGSALCGVIKSLVISGNMLWGFYLEMLMPRDNTGISGAKLQRWTINWGWHQGSNFRVAEGEKTLGKAVGGVLSLEMVIQTDFEARTRQRSFPFVMRIDTIQ